MRSAYDILRVRRDASVAEIRRAYRILARAKHPDHARQDAQTAHEEFLAVRAAYRILVDDDRRHAHDRWLAECGPLVGGGGGDENAEAWLSEAVALEKRRARRERRRKRLRRLYD